MTRLPCMLRALEPILTALRLRAGRATTWLPWLSLALVVAAVLSPGTVTASILAFQSSPAATPLPPTATPPPPPPPTATPIPPTPGAPTLGAPTPAPPTLVPTPTPIPGQPTQPAPAPTVPLTATPTLLAFPTQTPTLPPPPPTPTLVQISEGSANEPIINWVKFWDTIAVTLAYPWLCCGVALLLLVPVILLYLEIKGRRPPSRPPEAVPEANKGSQE